MNELALGLCMLYGLDGDTLANAALTEACVQVIVPRAEWASQCAAECRRQGLSSCALHSYLSGRYYEREVAAPVRLELVRFWTPTQRLQLITGTTGELITPGHQCDMAKIVQQVGQDLPAAVKANAWRR